MYTSVEHGSDSVCVLEIGQKSEDRNKTGMVFRFLTNNWINGNAIPKMGKSRNEDSNFFF